MKGNLLEDDGLDQIFQNAIDQVEAVTIKNMLSGDLDRFAPMTGLSGNVIRAVEKLKATRDAYNKLKNSPKSLYLDHNPFEVAEENLKAANLEAEELFKSELWTLTKPIKALKLLLEAGFNTSKYSDGNPNYALTQAILQKDIKAIKLLLKHWEINLKNYSTNNHKFFDGNEISEIIKTINDNHNVLESTSLDVKEKVYVVKDVPRDGNCFFHAVALQVGINAEKLRNMAIDYIQNHKGHFREFLEEKDLNGYLKKMALDKVWADDIIIRALGLSLGKNIHVVPINQKKYTIDLKGINILHAEDHFMAILPKNIDVTDHAIGNIKILFPPGVFTAAGNLNIHHDASTEERVQAQNFINTQLQNQGGFGAQVENFSHEQGFVDAQLSDLNKFENNPLIIIGAVAVLAYLFISDLYSS